MGPLRAHFVTMLRWRFALALLLSALFGLAGQGVALAALPPGAVQMSEAQPGSPECMDMMAKDGTAMPGTSGRKGMCGLADCIALMMRCGGLAMTLAIDPSDSLAPFEAGSLDIAGFVSPLTGLSPPPDTHPPTDLI